MSTTTQGGFKIPDFPRATGPSKRRPIVIPPPTNPERTCIPREYFQNLHIDLLMDYAQHYKIRSPQSLTREELAAVFCAKNEWIPALASHSKTYTKNGVIVSKHQSVVDEDGIATAQGSGSRAGLRWDFNPDRLQAPDDEYSDDEVSANETNASGSGAGSQSSNSFPPIDFNIPPNAPSAWLSSMASSLAVRHTNMLSSLSRAKEASSSAAASVMHFRAILKREKKKQDEALHLMCEVIGSDVAGAIREDVQRALKEGGMSTEMIGGKGEEDEEEGANGMEEELDVDAEIEKAVEVAIAMEDETERPKPKERLFSPMKSSSSKAPVDEDHGSSTPGPLSADSLPSPLEDTRRQRPIEARIEMNSRSNTALYTPKVSSPLKRRRDADEDEEDRALSPTRVPEELPPRLPSVFSPQRSVIRREASVNDIPAFAGIHRVASPEPAPIPGPSEESVGQAVPGPSPRKKARLDESLAEENSPPSGPSSSSHREHVVADSFVSPQGRNNVAAPHPVPVSVRELEFAQNEDGRQNAAYALAWWLSAPLDSDEDMDMESDYVDSVSEASTSTSDDESSTPASHQPQPLRRAHTRFVVLPQGGVDVISEPSYASSGPTHRQSHDDDGLPLSEAEIRKRVAHDKELDRRLCAIIQAGRAAHSLGGQVPSGFEFEPEPENLFED